MLTAAHLFPFFRNLLAHLKMVLSRLNIYHHVILVGWQFQKSRHLSTCAHRYVDFLCFSFLHHLSFKFHLISCFIVSKFCLYPLIWTHFSVVNSVLESMHSVYFIYYCQPKFAQTQTTSTSKSMTVTRKINIGQSKVASTSTYKLFIFFLKKKIVMCI